MLTSFGVIITPQKLLTWIQPNPKNNLLQTSGGGRIPRLTRHRVKLRDDFYTYRFYRSCCNVLRLIPKHWNFKSTDCVLRLKKSRACPPILRDLWPIFHGQKSKNTSQFSLGQVQRNTTSHPSSNRINIWFICIYLPSNLYYFNIQINQM